MSRAEAVQDLLARIPFAKTLNMRCEVHGNEMTATLPFADHLIGNTALPALHGGAIAAFLEITAMAQVYLSSEIENLPKPIDLTIDYLRTGRAEDMFARAVLRKQGSRMTSVHAEAWQTDTAKPVAALRAQFLVAPNAEKNSR
ncbi:MAG: PaaI family thioesterase [Pseudomonadota bacterium]